MIAVLGTAALAFVIVLSAMLMLTAVCLLLRRLSRHQAAMVVAGAGDTAHGIEPDVMAVIAAAVAVALGPHAIIHRVHVHRGGEADRWSRAGRLDIMVSHRVGPTR